MNFHDAGIFRPEGPNRATYDGWAATLTTDELERELISGIKELLTKSNDRAVLKVQALNREYVHRDCELFPERASPLPFEGISTLLAYAATGIREWEILKKGENTPAPDELDQLGAWHFANVKYLPKPRE